MSYKAWIAKIATATLLFLGLVVFVFMGRKLRRDFLVAQAEIKRVEAAVNESQRPHPRLWSPSPKGFFSDPLMENCCDAIVLENHSRLQMLVPTLADINLVGKDGMTLLFYSYIEGDIDAFKILLDHGALPDIPITQSPKVRNGQFGIIAGESVLFNSCRPWSDRVFFFEVALPFTKSPNSRGRNGETILHRFILNWIGTPKEQLSAILATGVDVSVKRNDGLTALDLAQTYHPEFVDDLRAAEKMNY